MVLKMHDLSYQSNFVFAEFSFRNFNYDKYFFLIISDVCVVNNSNKIDLHSQIKGFSLSLQFTVHVQFSDENDSEN